MRRHSGGALRPVIAVILALLLTAWSPAQALDLNLAQQHSLLAIRLAARTWGVDEGWLDQIALCESTWTPSAVGDDGEAVGLFQWHEDTWAAFANALDRSKGRENAWAAAFEAAKAVREGHAAWWTCAR